RPPRGAAPEARGDQGGEFRDAAARRPADAGALPLRRVARPPQPQVRRQGRRRRPRLWRHRRTARRTARLKLTAPEGSLDTQSHAGSRRVAALTGFAQKGQGGLPFWQCSGSVAGWRTGDEDDTAPEGIRTCAAGRARHAWRTAADWKIRPTGRRTVVIVQSRSDRTR